MEPTFEELCRQVIEQLGEELYTLTKKNVIPEDQIIDELKDCDEPIYDPYDIEDLFGEVGCPICRRDGELFLGDISDPGVGGACRIDDTACSRHNGEYVGTFHTHPLGGNVPSVPDIMCALQGNEKIMCIGGTINNEPAVTCYGIKDRNQLRTRLSIPGLSYYPPVEDDPALVIEFYREEPGPTAGDLLENLSESIVRDIVSFDTGIDPSDPEIDELVEEFYDTLREGEIPDSYLETITDQPSEGELDEFELYPGETTARITQRQKEWIERDLHICELPRR